jgi:hypothetical protein
VKARQLLPLLLFALHVPGAYAQNSAAEVSPTQIAGFKGTMDSSCRDAGKSHGDPAPHVESVCACLRQVLEENVTFDNWRQAYFEQNRGNAPEVQKLLIIPNQDKLRACANKP